MYNCFYGIRLIKAINLVFRSSETHNLPDLDLPIEISTQSQLVISIDNKFFFPSFRLKNYTKKCFTKFCIMSVAKSKMKPAQMPYFNIYRMPLR